MLNSMSIVKTKSLIESKTLKFMFSLNIKPNLKATLIMQSCLLSRILRLFTIVFYSKTIEMVDIK